MSKDAMSITLTFDFKGIIHFEFLPQGQTVNQYVYKEIIRRLMRSVQDKRRDLWENNAWVLLHDNAPGHSALSIRWFLAERNVPTLEQPPYSPDLAPCDFFPIPQAQWGDQGDPISCCVGHQKGCDDGAPEDSRRSLPGVHRSMEEEDGQVCEAGGKLF